jgi:integrase
MTRRRRGSGTIVQRADGWWSAQLDGGVVNGKRVRRAFLGRTAREVDAKLTLAKAALQMGVPVGTGRALTVETYLTRWVEAKAHDVRPNTGRSYRGLTSEHLIPRLGHMRLVDLGPADVEAMMRVIVASGRSPRTAMHCRRVLANALHDAQREGLLQRNAASLARPVRVPERRVEAMEPSRIRELLEQVDGDPLGPLVVFAIGTGARLGECLGLRWVDVADDYSTVSLEHQIYKGELVSLKTDKSRRTLRLQGTVRAALMRQRLAAGESEYVFPNSDGGPLDGSRLGKRWRALRARVGLQGLRFHDLRHQAASLMLASGADLRTVMNRLGHSQISLTANTYTHLIQDVDQEAAERMDALLGS